MTPRLTTRPLLAAAFAGALAGSTAPAAAQAWVPPRGEGAVSIQVQDALVVHHLLPTVQRDRGRIRAETLLADVTYGVTDKLAVSMSIPFVSSQYQGTRAHDPVIDNGRFHSTFQDFRFDVRYNLARNGLVLTPFAGTILPSHDYVYFAHSAAGRDLRELQVGTYWATLLDPVLPGLFVQGRVSHGFEQRVVDISRSRSNLDLEIGYFVKPELRVFASGAAQLTHGGIDLNGNSKETLSPPLWIHHDQIGRENYLNLGIGAAYDLTETVGVYGSVQRTAAGRNVHAMDHAVTAGVSWSFATRRAAGRDAEAGRAARLDQEAAKTLARCICQKEK